MFVRTCLPIVVLIAACEPRLAVSVPDVAMQRQRVVTLPDGAMVAVDVLATDALGHPIACGDGVLDATVSWPGHTATIAQATCGEGAAPDVALVLDNSGSQETALGVTRSSARTLADDVLALGGRVGIVRVSTVSRPLSPLTSDASEVHDALDGMFVNRGWTALWDGVRQGFELLDEGRDTTPPTTLEEACLADAPAELVLYTNGVENNSGGEQLRTKDDDGVDTTFADLDGLTVNGARVPIHTIGLGRDVDPASLQELSARTGGGYVGAETHGQLPEAFDLAAGWVTQERRVCAQLTDDTCGPIEVEVSWTLSEPLGGDPCATGLGEAGEFDVVAFDRFTTRTDVEGRVLAHAADLQAFSVGRLTQGGPALVSHELTASNGQFWGDSVYRDLADVSANVGWVDGSLVQAEPVDLDSVQDHLEDLSAGLAALAPTEAAQVQRYGSVALVTLSTTAPGMSVFELSTQDLAGLASLTLSAPPGATLVVNVRGEVVDLMNFGIQLVGITARDVLWNAPDTTLWRTTNVGWKGSVLAPHADVVVDNGNLDGTAAGLRVSGTGEWHHHPFRGALSCPAACETGTCGQELASGTEVVSVDVPCP